MVDRISTYKPMLFYSYSHADKAFRKDMEEALKLLENDNLLRTWSDQEIVPGTRISNEIREKLEEAEIIAFLISPSFIASDACLDEWRRASNLAKEGKAIIQIPIILRPCAWKDFLGDSDFKALPNDGKPVTLFPSKDVAWLQVYEGIKLALHALKKTRN